MCGIIAVNSKANSVCFIDDALKSIRHRGPDDFGIFESKKNDCKLGQVRLSIMDLSSAGHQPMYDRSKQFIISFNGEIYNFKVLKAELENKYGFISWQSNTDTEVIIEGFAREGVDFLNKLNGIFSLAIYDTKSQKMFVLRDPIGIKPLYIINQNNLVIFSSEIKAFLEIPGLSITMRKQSLADVLTFMYVPDPYTMYNEITKVDPGVCYEYQLGNLIYSHKLFSHLSEKINFKSEAEVIDTFRETFSSAVRRQLISDVPVSLFLSGGLDSSAIASEAVRNGANIKDAYTISISGKDNKLDQQSDDLKYAKIVSDKFGLDLKVIEAEDNMMKLLPELSRFLEDGIADPAAINTYLISKSARNDGVKVLLSGQGADEYLGGYRRYLAEKLYQKIPSVALKSMSLFGRVLPKSIPGRFNGDFRRIKKFIDTASLNSTDRLLSLYMWNSSSEILGLFKNSEGLQIAGEHRIEFESHQDKDVLDAMMLVDQKFDLASLNLSYTDKMSMMVGVEARVPFLDFDLIKVMNSIPLDMKLKGQVQKYVLKKAMEPYLPSEVIYRQKAGFSLPIRSWMKESNDLVNYYFDSSRIDKQGLFNSQKLNQILDEQHSGKRDHAHTLFAMLSLQIWLDNNISY